MSPLMEQIFFWNNFFKWRKGQNLSSSTAMQNNERLAKQKDNKEQN